MTHNSITATMARLHVRVNSDRTGREVSKTGDASIVVEVRQGNTHTHTLSVTAEGVKLEEVTKKVKTHSA